MKASRPPHVFDVWLWVGKGMIPVEYFCPLKCSLCVSQFSWRSLDCHNVEVCLATTSFVDDISRFRTLVSVCLSGVYRDVFVFCDLFFHIHPSQKVPSSLERRTKLYEKPRVTEYKDRVVMYVHTCVILHIKTHITFYS